MRIDMVLGTFPRTPSGGALVVYQYASALAARGHEVRVWHVEPRPSALEAGRRLVRNVASGGLRSRIRWTRLHPEVRLERVRSAADLDLVDADVVVPTFWTTVRPTLGRVSARQRVVHFVQADETTLGPPDEVEAIYHLPCPKIAVAPRLRDRLVAFGVAPGDVSIVTNGVDLPLFPPGPATAQRPRRVTFLAGDVPVKGLEVAADVVRRVGECRADVRWSAFGPGRRPRGLPACVEYTRSVPQDRLAPDFYHRAAVFLCTSHAEGWGLPALEAMACGTPVVSTRNGGVDNFAVDGDTALLRPAGDAAALADAVLELLDDPDRAAAIASRALVVGRAHAVHESAGRFEAALLGSPVPDHEGLR
ncbi:glycosyltransferase family 4 protein [Actinomycetospora chiangmaiensis]|uniref:glycosyltransferase family 4 protein n=1 Tax=Actinomycetospora chiangmaiensis TaxID=402650 RepID=UPI00039AB8CE|nr:glycosyltransferase family 4 protein [Actinomycetospora chiangmaiensis]